MSHIIFTTNDLFTCSLGYVTCITFSTLYFFSTFQLCSTRWFHWFCFPPSAALASNYVLFKFYWLIIWCAAAVPAWLPGFSNPLLSVSVQWAWSAVAGRATGRELIRLLLYKCTVSVHVYTPQHCEVERREVARIRTVQHDTTPTLL